MLEPRQPNLASTRTIDDYLKLVISGGPDEVWAAVSRLQTALRLLDTGDLNLGSSSD